MRMLKDINVGLANHNHLVLFQTFMAGVLRTCGVALRAEDPAFLFVPGDIEILQRRANHNPLAAASGKVALVTPRGIHIMQTRKTAKRVWCGNACAAAAFLAAAPRFVVHGPALRHCNAEAVIDGTTVGQSWIIDETGVESGLWRGRRVARLGVLNDYAIVEGPLPAGVEPEDARRALVGGGLERDQV